MRYDIIDASRRGPQDSGTKINFYNIFWLLILASKKNT